MLPYVVVLRCEPTLNPARLPTCIRATLSLLTTKNKGADAEWVWRDPFGLVYLLAYLGNSVETDADRADTQYPLAGRGVDIRQGKMSVKLGFYNYACYLPPLRPRGPPRYLSAAVRSSAWRRGSHRLSLPPTSSLFHPEACRTSQEYNPFLYGVDWASRWHWVSCQD